MAIVSRGGGPGGGGGGGGGDMQSGTGAQEILTNLPPRTGPICGRRVELRAIAEAFTRAQHENRTGRVEVVGERGRGVTAVAVELARRAGTRFPGGAWLLRADMGVDLAWADIAAVRGETHTTDLADLVRRERERFGAEPRALLVVDGVSDEAELDAALPTMDDPHAADVFVVTEKPTGRFEDIVEVGPVPEHAPRRIAHAVLRTRDGDAMVPPVVRVQDGLALTATIAARAAVANAQTGRALSIPGVKEAVNEMVPLVGRNPMSLEVLLLTGVAHPSLIAVDALHGAVSYLRSRHTGEDQEVEHEHLAGAVFWLVQLGLLQLDEETRVSIHPLVQEVVRSMAKTDDDRALAQEALAHGLIGEAREAIGDEGVDVRKAALHQLRHLRETSDDVVRALVAPVIADVEGAMGIGAGA